MVHISPKKDIRFKIIPQGEKSHSEYGKKIVKLVKVKEDKQLIKDHIQFNGYILISDCELHEG